MKKNLSIALMMAIALTGTVGLTACSSEEIDENVVYDSSGNAGVKSEFVISIPRSVVGTTRMGGAITQSAGTVDQFRGIDNIRLIAFSETPTASTEKNSDVLELEAIKALSSPGEVNYKVYLDQFVPVGTKHFMFYGKAIDKTAETAITSMEDKFKYGILHPSGLDDFTTPSGVTFSLEQIADADAIDDDEVGPRIVTFLTELANIEISTDDAAAPNNKWSTTTNLSLATLYKNFIGLTTASSSSLAAILSRLYFSADRVLPKDPARKLADAIRAKVSGVCSSLTEGSPATLTADYVGYPVSLGLPEGAARVEWNESAAKFVNIAAEYSESFHQELTDYLYPAALWYYVSTPLKAANVKKSGAYDAEGNWKNVIDNVYKDAKDAVEGGTQSIALKDPVQYGVGRVETKITMVDDTYYDGNGKEVNIDNGYTLKGFLIGGQNTVRYDFTSKLNENMPIYDRDVPEGIVAKKGKTTPIANQTLALETKADQVVNAALELVNNGADFMGADGIIPAGGTFYLAVKLDPKTASNYKDFSNNPLLDKIVIQDHVTKLTITIKNGKPSVVYIKDGTGVPIGIDTNGDGVPDTPTYDINGDGNPDTFIDPAHGGPGWDTDGDGNVDIPVTPDPDTGEYPNSPVNPEGLGDATNGIPDLSSPSIELGTSVDLEWQEGLILEPQI